LHLCSIQAVDCEPAQTVRQRRQISLKGSGDFAGPLDLAAKLANSIGRSNTLHKTYAPVDIETVRNVDDARIKGRRRMRAENKAGDFVSTPQPNDVSTLKTGDAK
jgi:hypothetical protein